MDDLRSNEIVFRAQNFILLNARLLERRVFDFLYQQGSREGVIIALRAYQNPDGGFGNGLEPDKRCPDSQPIDAEFALTVLDLVNGFSDVRQGKPLVKQICDYLVTILTPEGGVPNALPSINRYPHAPWWETPPDPPAALNPTASILGLLLKHGVRHPCVDQVVEFCWKAIAATNTREYHDLMPAIAFLEYAPERTRANQELARIANRIREPGMVAYDPDASGYAHKPLDWAPTPTSYCRQLFSDEMIDRHLNALAARQRPDGGWPIAWSPLSPGVELEWRGWITIRSVQILKAYGRLSSWIV